MNIAVAPADATATAAGAAAVAAIVALQLDHSTAGRKGTRPRAWGLTLTVQTLLPFTLFRATTGYVNLAILGMVGFPDLLGLGLSAVALKCDLVVRLLGRDDDKARGELVRLLEVTAKAQTDIQSITDQGHRLSLPAELASARDVLASAGIDVVVDDGGVRAEAGAAARGQLQLPAEVDAVLATVLREAVTNILRHTKAQWCTIELSTSGDAVRLQVTNDGAPGGPSAREDAEELRQPPGGRALGSLAARTVALGGRLSAHAEGGQFQLTAQLPLPA